MAFLKLDDKTNEFVLSIQDTETRWSGTLNGVLDMLHLIRETEIPICMSSDLNHPDEFPDFEEHSIDVAAGYYDGAIKAGVIKIDKG